MQSANSPAQSQDNNNQTKTSKPLSLNRTASSSEEQSMPRRKGLSAQAQRAVKKAIAAQRSGFSKNTATTMDTSDVYSKKPKNRFNTGSERKELGNFKEPKDSYQKADRKNTFENTDREVLNLDEVFETEVPVGRLTKLAISEIIEQGAFVDGMNLGQLFIPNSQLPDEVQIGDEIKVFIYNEGDRFCATAKRPVLMLGMTGLLKIKDIRKGTVYLEMGIPKDLVVPVSEQRQRRTPRIGDTMMVFVAIDEQGRLYGTQNFNKFIREVAFKNEFKPQQPVKIVAIAHTPLGFRVIVEDKVYGLMYASEQKWDVVLGKRYDGFIKCIRPDGRVDATLQLGGREGIDLAARDILKALGYSDGFLSFNDKTDPQVIEDYLHMSKGKFKKAIGSLYKSRYIEIGDDGIKLTEAGFELFNSEFGKGASLQEKDAKSQASVGEIDSSFDVIEEAQLSADE